MSKTQDFEDYKLIFAFMHPEDELKSWINEDTFNNLWRMEIGWMMEVIENIEKKFDNKYSVMMQRDYCNIECDGDLIVEVWGQDRLECGYDAALQFVKWLNDQPN